MISENNKKEISSDVIQKLKDRNIRITPQRKAIIEYLIGNDEHPTVEQIYNHLIKSFQNLSLATVYNNLKVLVEEGFVYEMKFSDVTSRYDFMGHQHGHLICNSCGNIFDIDIPNLTSLRDTAFQQIAAIVQSLNVEFHGICQDCQNKKINL